jgi:hypothetical protein
MWTAQVESDMGEVLLILMDDGGIAGKALLAFQSSLHVYCMNELDEKDRVWFLALQSKTHEDLCTIGNYFLRAIISGDMNYSEDEFEFYKHRTSGFEVTEEMFRQALEYANSAWTSIELVIESINTFISCLKQADLPAVAWCDPEYLVSELDALARTLSILLGRHAKKIRINIE